MSALQWALLILSVAIVVAVVVISRRDRGLATRSARVDESESADEPAREQLDIFAASSEAESRSLQRRTAPLFEAFEQSDTGSAAADIDLGVVSKPRKVPVEPPPAAPTSAPSHEARPSRTVPLQEPEVEESPVNGAPLIAPLGGVQFDEFGVGRPRRRSSPSLDLPESAESAPTPPAPPPERLPPWVRAPGSASPVPPPASNDPVPAAVVMPPKIVSLLIVERGGGHISGNKLHTVLAAQGLVFGSKQIYHRMVRDQAVFSVASLTKPGVLVPGDAAQFSTPGLSVFMVLPGPVKPVTALHDLLATAQGLARALNAEVYDSKKQPLSSELMRALQADVEAWARAAQG